MLKNYSKLLVIAFVLIGGSMYAQVGIGTRNPDAQAALEISSSNKGILIPRVQLLGDADKVTISVLDTEDEGLMVYNDTAVPTPATVAAGGPVGVGFYFWDGAATGKWIKISTGGDLTDISVKTADYTIAATDATVLANTNGGVVTISLPKADTVKPGQKFIIKRQDVAEGNVLTIDLVDATDIFNGVTNGSIESTVSFQSWIIQSDGINTYYLVGAY